MTGFKFMKHIVDVAKAQTLQMLDAPMSDKQKCPLCGQPNRCAMAGRHPVGACWCVSIRLTADMLEAVPTEDRGVRCICDTCARGLASGVGPNRAMQPTPKAIASRLAGRRNKSVDG